MFTLESLAKGYNAAKNQGNTEDKNMLGNMFIMQIINNPKEILSLSDTSEIGIALFSISMDSKDEASINSSSYQTGLQLAFLSLYRALKSQPNNYGVKVNMNILWLTFKSLIIRWYQTGLMIQYKITEPIKAGSPVYFLFKKIDILESELAAGTLDENSDYLEYLTTVSIGIEASLKRL